MKQLCALFLIFIISSSLYSQKNTDLQLDILSFNRLAETAEWLYTYDAVAWWTSDSVMTNDKSEIERLGGEWFCFQGKDSLWHAVYGSYEDNTFDLVFHYKVEADYTIRRVYESVDTSMTNSFSRALNLAKGIAAPELDTMPVGFNQYIRRNDDNTITVWLLPAMSKNNDAVYGAEFIYTIDENGLRILKDESYIQGPLRGFAIGEPREIWVNYSELDQPSLDGVFFVWYFKKYFTSIKLETKYYISSIFKTEEGAYYWIHVQKEKEAVKKNKKNKKKN